MKLRSATQGFTIIELMIATSIFSVILLIGSAAIIQVSRYYQKGVTTNRTQEAARRLQEEIADAIQLSPATPIFSGNRLCIGPIRYTFATNTQVVDDSPDTAQHQGLHAVWRDEVIPAACPTMPAADLTAPTPSANGKELIPQRMRLREINVAAPPGTSLWTVRIRIMAGEDDLIEDLPPPRLARCKPVLFGGQFCADAAYETKVVRRLP